MLSFWLYDGCFGVVNEFHSRRQGTAVEYVIKVLTVSPKRPIVTGPFESFPNSTHLSVPRTFQLSSSGK